MSDPVDTPVPPGDVLAAEAERIANSLDSATTLKIALALAIRSYFEAEAKALLVFSQGHPRRPVELIASGLWRIDCHCGWFVDLAHVQDAEHAQIHAAHVLAYFRKQEK